MSDFADRRLFKPKNQSRIRLMCLCVIMLLLSQPQQTGLAAQGHYLNQESIRWGLDPTFGSGGVVIYKPENALGLSTPFQAFVRPDNKLLLAGCYLIPPPSTRCSLFVFGSNGGFESLGGEFVFGQPVLGMQSDGRVVVVVNPYPTLARYNLDLSKDLSFYPNGLNDLRPTGVISGVWQPVMQADDKMLITNVLSDQLKLGRLNSDDTVDMGYSPAPITDVTRFQGADRNGRLVVQRFVDCRTRVYSFEGVLLGTLFDSSTPIPGDLCRTKSFTPHPNGGFIWTVDSVNPKLIYRSSGNNGIDTTFGVSGTLTVMLPSGLRWVNADLPIASQADGKVIAASLVTAAPEGQSALGKTYPLIARYNIDGSPDKAFGELGSFIVNLGIFDRVSQIVSLPDVKILVVGLSNRGELIMMRLAPFTVRSNVFFPFVSTS